MILATDTQIFDVPPGKGLYCLSGTLILIQKPKAFSAQRFGSKHRSH